tara:strand:+ start:58 stop:375 length:318 start_codon:yes stop_codon:yes gene_type:complete
MSKKVVTKSLVINHLNESIGLSKKECQYFLESFLEVIFFELKNHSDVKIVNFGIFKIKNKKPRIGRNPKTRQEVIISERNVVKFKPSDFLINLINSNIEDKDETK